MLKAIYHSYYIPEEYVPTKDIEMSDHNYFKERKNSTEF
jgi:hypothetical protein